MGGGYFDAREVKPVTAGQAHSMDLAGATRLQKAMEPEGRHLECTASSAIVFALDVTGSMQDWPRVIYDKLPMMYGQAIMQGYLEDPAISFCGVGDVLYDNSPLQVADFAQGNELDTWLSKLHLEGGGGPNNAESYELAALFYSRHATFPGAAQKPFFFFTADEEIHPVVQRPQYIGEQSAEGMTSDAIFAELMEKYEVFCLFRGNTSDLADCIPDWERRLGVARVLRVSDPKAVVDVVLGVLALTTRARNLAEYEGDLRERGQSKERIREVKAALNAYSALIESAPSRPSEPKGGAPSAASGPAPSTGELRFRECAGAVVISKEGLVLVGERIDKPGSFQFPQGGIDQGERPAAAARREMYEEIGLRAVRPGEAAGEADAVAEIGELDLEEKCYEVPDQRWREALGFDGQRMHFTAFAYRGDGLPACDLSGLGGEHAEFSSVKWMRMEDVVDSVVAFKRPVYTSLVPAVEKVVREWKQGGL